MFCCCYWSRDHTLKISYLGYASHCIMPHLLNKCEMCAILCVLLKFWADIICDWTTHTCFICRLLCSYFCPRVNVPGCNVKSHYYSARGGSCSCLKVCKLSKLLLEMCCAVSLFPLNKQVANKNHVSKSYLQSILTCLYRGIQYRFGLVCRKINFLDLSRKQARCTLLRLAFIQHTAVRIQVFLLWHTTVAPDCPLLYTNTSYTRKTCIHGVSKYLIFH